MLVFSCKVHHHRDLGFGDFIGKNATLPHPVLVHMQHDFGGFLNGFVEETLQYMHHKFHRCVVIVQQENPIKVGLFCFGAGQQQRARAVIPALVIIGSHHRAADNIQDGIQDGLRQQRRHGLDAHGVQRGCRY